MTKIIIPKTVNLLKRPFKNPTTRHSGLDLACPVPDTGESRKYLKILDARLRGNDEITILLAFCKGLLNSKRKIHLF